MSVTGFQRRRRELAKNGRKAETRDAERQAAEKEPTFNELRHEAREREIEGYGKMNKEQLIETLKAGD